MKRTKPATTGTSNDDPRDGEDGFKAVNRGWAEQGFFSQIGSQSAAHTVFPLRPGRISVRMLATGTNSANSKI